MYLSLIFSIENNLKLYCRDKQLFVSIRWIIQICVELMCVQQILCYVSIKVRSLFHIYGVLLFVPYFISWNHLFRNSQIFQGQVFVSDFTWGVFVGALFDIMKSFVHKFTNISLCNWILLFTANRDTKIFVQIMIMVYQNFRCTVSKQLVNRIIECTRAWGF